MLTNHLGLLTDFVSEKNCNVASKNVQIYNIQCVFSQVPQKLK